MIEEGLVQHKQRRPSRACIPCRNKKRRCDGKDFCDNCRENGRDCVYSVAKKRGRKSKHGRDTLLTIQPQSQKSLVGAGSKMRTNQSIIKEFPLYVNDGVNLSWLACVRAFEDNVPPSWHQIFNSKDSSRAKDIWSLVIDAKHNIFSQPKDITYWSSFIQQAIIFTYGLMCIQQDRKNLDQIIVRAIKLFSNCSHVDVRKEIPRFGAFLHLYDKDNPVFRIKELERKLVDHQDTVFDPFNMYGKHTGDACRYSQNGLYYLQEMKKMEDVGTVPVPMVLCCRFAVLECYSLKLFYFGNSFLKESGLSLENLMKMANDCGEMLSSSHSEKRRYVVDFWHQKYSACLYAKYAILYFKMGDRNAALASIQHFIRGYSYFDRSPGNLFHAQIPILISICDNFGDDASIKILRNICTNSESLNWMPMAAEQTGFNAMIYSMAKDQLNSVRRISNEEYTPPEPPQKVVKRASYQKPTPTLPPINTFTEQRLDPILPAWKSPKSYSSTQDQLSFMTDDFSLPSLQKLPDIHFLHEELKHQQNTNIPTLPILPTPKRLSRTSYDNHSLPSTFIPNSNPNHLRETLPPLSKIVFISQPSIDTNYIYMISKLDQANPKIVRIDTEEDN